MVRYDMTLYRQITTPPEQTSNTRPPAPPHRPPLINTSTTPPPFQSSPHAPAYLHDGEVHAVDFDFLPKEEEASSVRRAMRW